MSKKTFSWHFQNSEFFEQHFVTREYLHKSFIRDTLTENKNIKIVDNWSSVNDFFFKNQKSKVIRTFKKISKWKKKLIGSRIEKGRKLKTGNLIHLNYPILRHKFWDKIQLQVPMMPNARPVNLIRLVKTLRKSAVNSTNKKKLLPVQLLKPTKGGFIVRFSTIKGFLPTSQFKKAKNALQKKCQKVNPLDNVLSIKKFNLDNNKFAHIFAYFKNPKVYLECRDEKVVPHLKTLKSNGNNTNLIEKYHFLKENTEYFKNFEIKKLSSKLSSKKKYTLHNFSKIKLPLQYNHTRFTYKNKEPIFVKKRKLGKRRFFRRNFNLTAKKNKYFHKLHSTVFFYDKYKHSSFVFKPKFKKHFKFRKNWKFNKNKKFNNNFKKFPNKDNKFDKKFQDTNNKFQNKENKKFQHNNKFTKNFNKNFENKNINSQNSNNKFENKFKNNNKNFNNNFQKKNFSKNNDNKFQHKDDKKDTRIQNNNQKFQNINNKPNKKFENNNNKKSNNKNFQNNNKNFQKDSKFNAKNKDKNDL